MKETLYICHTYYHTLITLVKMIVFNEKTTILLSNKINDSEDLKSRLLNTGYFYNIIIFNTHNQPRKTRKWLYDFKSKKELKSYVELNYNVDFRKYNIYIFNDYTVVGKYLVQEKIQYHLIEDALDYYKYFDEYYGLSKKTYTKGNIKYFIKETFGLGYQLWGRSPYCLDIEVNELDGIKISKDKVFAVSRRELFDMLTEENKALVYKTYAAGKSIEGSSVQNVIVCTQPLYEAHHVESMDEQMAVFEAVVDRYKRKGYHIVVKPHPRDEGDYTDIIKKYDCGFIDRNLPSEILDYDFNVKYDLAISITSTSINFLQCAQEKIILGMGFVKEVLTDES